MQRASRKYAAWDDVLRRLRATGDHRRQPENGNPVGKRILEARREDGKMRWEYACGRFSDRSLYIQRKDKEVWSSIRSENNTWSHDPLHLYHNSPEKIVTPEGEVLPSTP